MNLDSRPDRLAQVTRELDAQGIVFERFPAIANREGWRGYNESIEKVFNDFRETENLFLFEDDCYFEAPFDHLVLEELPKGWDGLWLGSNLQSEHQIRVSERLAKLENGWNTHAVLLSKSFRDWCLFNWNRNIVFDEWVRVYALPIRTCYLLNPMIAFQRPSQSDIINGFADYTEAWEIAKSRLKA